ncbi:MAG: VWA domain-containing protein [Melioribacteraceae bacterium]|nr:VWA domain-containing protein [Melioribacteraceae bacterium]MCO6472339.1 VWA domain-containing protein [Melioribacteraceae bacterium]MDD3557544.1 VWA domain-containing protein [Melioribacteraceae bacterium]
MFRFAHIEYLNLLYLIPVLIFLVWYTQRKTSKSLLSFANKKMHSVLFPLRSRFKNSIKYSLLIISAVLIIFSLANPQIGTKIEEVKQVGIDVFILLDVSNSMRAEDIKPNRLEKAKHEIAKLIRKLQGDRIGLIVFAGRPYIQFPLTTDYSAANLFLSAVDFNTVPQQGTAIGASIELAVRSFKQEEDTKKAIIVITDGEDHEGDLMPVVEDAVGKGIQIYTIGLGSTTGEPIPLYNESGNKSGYKKDRQGNVVLTKLDETTLKEIASIGNGAYYRGTNTDDELEKIYNDLAELEATEFGATRITEYEDRYYYFLIPAFILLILEFFISNKKSMLLLKLNKVSK